MQSYGPLSKVVKMLTSIWTTQNQLRETKRSKQPGCPTILHSAVRIPHAPGVVPTCTKDTFFHEYDSKSIATAAESHTTNPLLGNLKPLSYH